MACGVINHDSCAHDSNCGLTCDGVFQNELLVNPGQLLPSDHDAFIVMCEQFYWPNGCAGAGDFPDIPSVGIFDMGAFMVGFAVVSICYFVSMPVRIASRALRSAGKS